MKQRTPSQSRNIERMEWAFAACLLLWFGCTVAPHAWRALNTDFPNYYITAHLLRSHVSTSRIYEWVWFQRQQDYLQTGQTFSAMQPLTPFSALFLWPFASLAPLAAKHCWLIVNAGLLVVSAGMLRSIVGLRWSRIALLIAASYPLERNFLTGQFYVLLLFLIVMGLWLHLRGYRISAGSAIAIAIGLKIFPLLYVLYFLRKRDWRALFGVVAGGLAVAAISIAAFGWKLNQLYVLQLLPREMRGDSTNPYDLTSASFTVLFHRLFVFEPTLNPHPMVHAAWLLPVLLAIVQLLIVTPLIVLVVPRIKDSRRIQLEWSVVLLACLTLSPMPASYHFVLLLLPAAVLAKKFIAEDSGWKLATLIFLFLAIGFTHWPMNSVAPLYVPRLYATISLYILALSQLRPREQRVRALAARNVPWIAALTCLAVLGMAMGLRSQPGDSVYAGRIALANEAFSFSQPLATDRGISFIAMQHNGYRAMEDGVPADPTPRADELTHAVLGSHRWIERVSASSQIISSDAGAAPIADAEQPIVSPDGRWLAYQREDHGVAALWLHALDSSQPDLPITPPGIDVLEAAFAPGGDIIFSALNYAGVATLFERNLDGRVVHLLNDETRYPAVSPDGKWLVYSQLRHGSWNLRLRERSTGRTTPLTDEPCNAIQAAWEPDSRTVLFASDCGRAVGLTALYRRQVIP
jgi:Glycosyltransferase family 87/WD40-like Beta Propeller Repeat